MKTTSLVKKSSLGKHYGAVTNVDDLKYFLDENVAILIQDTGVDLNVLACGRMWDISHFANKARPFSTPTDGDKFMVLEAKVVNPIQLPYELGPKQEIFIIRDEWDFTRFSDMESAIYYIEDTFKRTKDVNIEDFIILIGVEIAEHILKLVLSRISYLSFEDD